MKGYLSITDVAEKWGISERLVNQYCIQGRIPGAERFGRSWAIPENASKPGRTRHSETLAHSAPMSASTGHMPMPLMNTPFALGRCLEAAKSIADPDSRSMAMAEYFYFSGQAEEAMREAEHLLNHPDLALRLSAYWVYAYASIGAGHIQRARYVLAEVKGVLSRLDGDASAELRALANYVSMGASVLLHLPLPVEPSSMAGCLSLLPEGLRFFALYIKAHYAYLQTDYRLSIGVVETALALGAHRYPIAAIYLHLMGTMDYMSLKQLEPARRHLLAAWQLARADDLIEPLGEHHGLLGGMLEAVIKKEWPEDFERIIAITYRFSSGWRKIHNASTGHDVADDLTTTEFAAAMLAARNWTNPEIAAHLGVSVSTVKRLISSALQKLGIRQRTELKQHMLQ